MAPGADLLPVLIDLRELRYENLGADAILGASGVLGEGDAILDQFKAFMVEEKCKVFRPEHLSRQSLIENLSEKTGVL